MAIRPPTRKPPTPTDVIDSLSLGYNGYTDPTLTKPQMWASAVNVFSGAYNYIQRARFALLNTPGGAAFTSLKFFGLPGLSNYLLADQGGKLWSYDTSTNPYTQTQRLNPYVDPFGAGSSQLNGPWMREVLQNIVYEMNGQVKQAGRLANAATIEGWGLDAPDASPQVSVFADASTNITAISRTSGLVTVTVVNSAVLATPGLSLLNVLGVTDTSYNGTFLCNVINSTTITYQQLGINSSSSGGSMTNGCSKAIGKSYAYAWENANKSHVGPPSPATQYIQFANQNAVVTAVEGLACVNTSSTSPIVTGTATFFTSAWVGRHLWVSGLGDAGRIVSVQSTTQLTLAANAPANITNGDYQIFDPQATHVRYYQTADGGATYFRVARNQWLPGQIAEINAGLQFVDRGASEPPNFPFTTETAQINNVPPPIGAFVREYQGRLIVFGVLGAPSSFFYSNQEATLIGQGQESFAPLNQVTVPLQNGSLAGWIEFPGAAIFWSDKQDMFRLTGLLTDNTVGNVATAQTGAQQGATIAQLPFALGCANPFAVDITPLGAIWLTTNAEVWLYTDTYAPRNIGRPIQDILQTISPSGLSLVRAKYYHAGTRNWFVLMIPANGASFNNTALILDLDLLASNGSPSYFTFDMATNSPSWFVYQPGTTIGGNWVARCDSVEVVYEQGGGVRLVVGQLGILEDIDFGISPNGGFGTEIAIPNGSVTLHAWGNDTAVSIKRPGWFRFLTNRDPSLVVTDGWSFQALGVDDDFYTFPNPLVLTMTPGVNDSSTLGGNPGLLNGSPFRHSPTLFKVGGVNFIMGRRLKFTINFPSATGTAFRLRAIEIGFGALPPS